MSAIIQPRLHRAAYAGVATAPAAPAEAKQQLQNLRIFLSVAGAQSITRAAEQLFKTPSAIARSISEFERCVGTSLFERKPRGMVLNIYGETVLLRASRINDAIQWAAEELLSNADAPGASAALIANLLFNSRKLELLINLATCRDLATAAAQMNMTTASATMALARIEAVLGQALFQRRTQDLVVTAAADRLALLAQLVFSELRHMGCDIAAISENLTGSVTIGTTVLGRNFVLPEALAAAITHHPELRVTTVEGTYEQLLAHLHSGAIDIAFAALRPSHLDQGLLAEPLCTDRLSVLVRADHPLTRCKQLHIADMLGERWILPALGRRAMVEASFHKLGLQPPTPCVATSDVTMLRQLLKTSDMLAVTSPDQLMSELRCGSLVELPVKLGAVSRDIGLVRRSGAKLSPAALAVIEAVRNEVRGQREYQ